MNFVEKLKSNINNLPTLPTVYASISEAMADPNARTEKIAQIISADQASAFKILKVANSPFYGFRGKIETISQAILFLGYGEIKNIIFALTIMNYFSRDKSAHRFNPVDCWAHSIGVGIISRYIGSITGERNVENYFLSGILHDIGKVLFFEFASKEYTEAIKLAESDNILIRDAEFQVFGVDHSAAGSILSEKWKIPTSIQSVIKNHHTGIDRTEHKKIVAAVHVADIVARALGLGYPGDNIIPQPNSEVLTILNIPPGYFNSLSEVVQQEYENFIRLMLVD